ncbi:MAG: VOC family protein [Anaerolineales bacterium]|nr:VOC family protein [Anaerolineales bacterium]MCB8960350.1 VOC family protein [Ardenticatenales bacterium]
MNQPVFSPGEWNVFCTDKAASLRFYRDLLGFVVTDIEDDAVHLRLGEQRLLLLPYAGAPADPHPYGQQATYSFDLMTPDLASAYTFLAEARVPMYRPWTPGAPSFIIRDPDNLVIEIIGQ